jgi:hypothetical protein
VASSGSILGATGLPVFIEAVLARTTQDIPTVRSNQSLHYPVPSNANQSLDQPKTFQCQPTDFPSQILFCQGSFPWTNLAESLPWLLRQFAAHKLKVLANQLALNEILFGTLASQCLSKCLSLHI